MIRLKCPKCGKVLTLNEAKPGAPVACPCGQKFRVPGAKAPNSAAASGKPKASVPGKSTDQPGGVKPSPQAARKTSAKPTVPAKKRYDADDDFVPYTMEKVPEPPAKPKKRRGAKGQKGNDEDQGTFTTDKEYQRKEGKRSQAEALIRGPAKALRLVAWLVLWLQIGGAIVQIVMIIQGSELTEGVDRNTSIGITIGGLVVGLIVTNIIIIGAGRMGRLESFGLSVVACIVGLLGLTLPFALWALVVLMKREVSSQFR